MLEAIILFGPALLASVIYCKLQNQELKTKDILIYTAVFAFLVNAFAIGITYLRGHSLAETHSLFANVGVATKYCALGLLAAVTLPGAFLIVPHAYTAIANRIGRQEKHETSAE